jgi:hypothetical protein
MSSQKEKTITGTFSRKNLGETFGPGFSYKGWEKHGKKDFGKIDKSSPAVVNCDVLLNKDGSINKTCKCRDETLVFKVTNASHVHSFEVTDAVFHASNLCVTESEAEMMVRSMNQNDNLQVKTRGGNMKGRERHLGDDVIDKKNLRTNYSRRGSAKRKRAS